MAQDMLRINAVSQGQAAAQKDVPPGGWARKPPARPVLVAGSTAAACRLSWRSSPPRWISDRTAIDQRGVTLEKAESAVSGAIKSSTDITKRDLVRPMKEKAG
jgi:hypothetical protein